MPCLKAQSTVIIVILATVAMSAEPAVKKRRLRRAELDPDDVAPSPRAPVRAPPAALLVSDDEASDTPDVDEPSEANLAPALADLPADLSVVEMGANADRRTTRQVYLITFSRTDGEGKRSPSEFTKAEFADMVLQAYAIQYAGNPIVQWACAEEKHAGGDKHFHMVIKTERVSRCKTAKNWSQRQSVHVHWPN